MRDVQANSALVFDACVAALRAFFSAARREPQVAVENGS
jgi:hypothetical protein